MIVDLHVLDVRHVASYRVVSFGPLHLRGRQEGSENGSLTEIALGLLLILIPRLLLGLFECVLDGGMHGPTLSVSQQRLAVNLPE